jgi:hypothetical protein
LPAAHYARNDIARYGLLVAAKDLIAGSLRKLERGTTLGQRTAS